jgi:N-terminal domain of anti-restriction factor ArdC
MATANLSKDPSEQIQFKQLLEEAVTKPGTLMRAYSVFWNYSLGNQILALLQANERGIPLGPIASFNRWKELGRHVKRGEKAITLCMPVTCKRTVKEQVPDGADTDSEVTFKRFVFRRKWFMLAQTDGAEFEPPSIPTWDRARALRTLSVEEIPFESLSGNVQGYARNRQIAINPLAQMPAKTTFHELAHIELGHTSEAVHDSEALPRNLKEVEAEAVALLCLESLVMDGAEYCRGYIQNWLAGAEIPERSAQRIFSAADKILKAGIERQEAQEVR